MNDDLITWSEGDTAGKAAAMEQYSKSISSYEGVTKGNHRSFLDIESNKSVRPGFNRDDYYAFRPNEAIPARQKRAIKMCMDAYDKVGIIRNIIDLMGDFGSQGISIVHENKSVEKFMKEWFRKVDGKERSERFLNNLYRTGQVFIYRSDAKITPGVAKYVRSIGSDIVVQKPNLVKGVIPWRYNFLNPLTIDVKDGDINMMMGRRRFNLSTAPFLDNFNKTSMQTNIEDTLPPSLKEQMKSGSKHIPLDEEKLSVFYYKKDDWQQWANPLTYAILDDIIMLEKMRLADLSALDGAISNIRLWTLGNLEHKIMPNKAAVDKLRDILISNVGGGTMELVWGPELTYTESNSQVYKFLGSEKYDAVLNSIYAGLGVPPTLTGMSGNGGGFTNNFISLKTLVERLQYGRDQLIKFWAKEFDIVRRSMGFRKAPHIVFDQMSLSDEAAEKALLIQLADRDIISHETILERFKEVAPVENVRLKREMKARQNDDTPEKAGPFHNPMQEEELEKMDKQHEYDLETKKMDIAAKPKPVGPRSSGPTTKKQSGPNGRPKNKRDTKPRKKRDVKPRSKPGLAELVVWANDSYKLISDTITKGYLAVNEIPNLRNMTRAQVVELETFKLDVLTNIEPLTEVDNDSIGEAIGSNNTVPVDFWNYLIENRINPMNLPLDEYRKIAIGSYIEYVYQD